MRTFQALGILLMYPTEDTQAALPELRNILRGEEMLPHADLEKLVPLFTYLEKEPMLDQQEKYVGLFDRAPSLSLHLFEHVYGENRDRGQALAELADLYASSDMFLKEGEMPDYLPAFMEFMALQPERESRRLLGEIGHIIQLMANRLAERGSVYAPLMALICSLCEPHPEAFRVEAADKMNPDKPVDLDATWEEPEAFPTGGCATTASPMSQKTPKHVKIEESHHG